MVMHRRLEQQWGISLNLPAELGQHVEGQVLPWTETQLQQLEGALARLPQALIGAAQVSYMCVARDLQRGELPHDGVAYEFRDRPEPKWIGLDVALFVDQRDEPDLRVSLFVARLLEEIAHVWDYRLQAAGSPYSSVGVEWLKIEFDRKGRRKPFLIPNRRMYACADEQDAEDWAAALVWYVFQPDRLRRRAPEHAEFVARLFQRCLSL